MSGGWLGRLLRNADQFHWFSAYLHDRRLDQQWRLATFGFTVFFTAIPVLMLVSHYGPSSAPTRAVAIGAAVLGSAAGSLWLVGWPTRAQSLLFYSVCSTSIAGSCLVISTSYGALMGCTMFAAVGGLLAFFHALVHVLANFSVGLCCALVASFRLFADTGDHALVLASLLLVIGLNIGVPLGVHALVYSLRRELRSSDRDPLTGLRNRRSFYSSVHEMMLERRGGRAVVNVTMIDVDDFKRLNDTRGHAAGDEALVRIAAVLRHNCGAGVIAARLGGEEFVVADLSGPERHAQMIERIRAGIAELPVRITASLGTCAAEIDGDVEAAHPKFLDQVIGAADAAMYRSKRAGGNRVQHRTLHPTSTSP
ncbi:diguanylate cyclase [Mycobacterium sp. AMU20-3851]|uniref:GGDEF domain-containing protein n=1 Tax=Mycobacterium sp. AMU20-3851 TaxID=3122055 RepID=UPI003754C181